MAQYSASERTKKFDLPLDHFDYKYIEGCSDIKELEKILYVLRSNEVGRYPDLETFCETKIKKLNPNSRILRKSEPLRYLASLSKEEQEDLHDNLQHWIASMKQNETRSYLNDLKDNCTHVSALYDILPEEERTIDVQGELPCVRDNVVINLNNTTNSKVILSRRKPNNRSKVPRDYSEWEKLEKVIDQQLASEEVESLPAGTSTHQKPITSLNNDASDALTIESTSRALSKLTLEALKKRAEDMSEGLRQAMALREKAKGNEEMHTGDLNAAKVFYDRSIAIYPSAAAYNNRCLIYLRQCKWKDAIADCDEVINQDPLNIKALFRRAKALCELYRYKEAERDLSDLLDVDPLNRRAQNRENDRAVRNADETLIVAKTMQSLMKVIREHLERKKSCSLPGGRRLIIEEVDEPPMANQVEKDADTSLQMIETAPLQYYDEAKVIVTESLEKPLEVAGSRELIAICNTQQQQEPLILTDLGVVGSDGDGDEGSTAVSHNEQEANPGSSMLVNNNMTLDSWLPTGTQITAYNFLRYWSSLPVDSEPSSNYFSLDIIHSENPSQRCAAIIRLLKIIGPHRLPSVLTLNFDAFLFEDIISAITRHCQSEGDWEFCFEVLKYLRQVPRFQIVAMLIKKETTESLKQLFDAIMQNSEEGPQATEMESVRKDYTNLW